MNRGTLSGRRWPRAVASVLAAVLMLAACSDPAPVERGGRRPQRDGVARAPEPEPTASEVAFPDPTPGELLLASSFEQPVCGRYVRPGPGCEFGYEGDDVETGEFDCRTGPSCARIGRMTHSHMGIIREVPIPGGHGFVGVAHRIPDIPDGAVPPERGYLEIMQLSPTDGSPGLPGYPVEVRLFPDRTLALALYRERKEFRTRWRAPVDEWFYVVVELNNGVGAPQRMWVFDQDDEPVASIEAPLDTRQRWPHAERVAQKIGGATSTLVDMDTFHDDWYIAETFMGPLRIDPSGRPIP